MNREQAAVSPLGTKLVTEGPHTEGYVVLDRTEPGVTPDYSERAARTGDSQT